LIVPPPPDGEIPSQLGGLGLESRVQRQAGRRDDNTYLRQWESFAGTRTSPTTAPTSASSPHAASRVRKLGLGGPRSGSVGRGGSAGGQRPEMSRRPNRAVAYRKRSAPRQAAARETARKARPRPPPRRTPAAQASRQRKQRRRLRLQPRKQQELEPLRPLRFQIEVRRSPYPPRCFRLENQIRG